MDEEQIPVPDNSGGSDEQTQGTGNGELITSKTFEGLHMVHTINGLAATHSKSLGGEVASTLLAGMTQQMSNDYQELKFKFEKLSEKYEEQRNVLEETRTDKAVLKNTINSERQNKHLRNFAITIGTGFMSTGIFLGRTQIDFYSVGTFGVGALFLLLGWFTGPKEVK